MIFYYTNITSFNHFSILGHGICFPFLLIVNNIAINSTCIFFSSLELFLWRQFPGVEFFGQRIWLLVNVARLALGCPPSAKAHCTWYTNCRLSEVYQEGNVRWERPVEAGSAQSPTFPLYSCGFPILPTGRGRGGQERGVDTLGNEATIWTSCWSSCR